MKLAPFLPLALAGCLAGPRTEPARAVAATTPMVVTAPIDLPLSWPQGGDCRRLAAAVLALPEADRQRLDPSASPFGIVATRPVAADIPVRTATAPCRLEVGLITPLDPAPAQAVAHRIVRSAYRSGASRSRNPRWEELDDAERRVNDRSSGGGRLLATGDPTLDMIGLFGKAVLGGIDWLGRRAAGGAIEAERAGTERSLETDRWAPYTYDVTTMAADRVAVVEVSLEGLSGSPVVARALLREAREIEIAKGRHRSDRGLLEDAGGVAGTASDLDLWRSQPPTLTVGRLLRALVEGEMAGLPEPPRPRDGGSRVRGSVGDDGVWRLRLPGELNAAAAPLAPDDP